ncbi:hypothetical protein HDU81_001712, partial [Chytriomyces hyalinus]
MPPTAKWSRRTFNARCREVMSMTLMRIAENIAPQTVFADRPLLEDVNESRETVPAKAPATATEEVGFSAADELLSTPHSEKDSSAMELDTRLVEIKEVFLSLTGNGNTAERATLNLAMNHRKVVETSEIQLYRHVLKAATNGCIEYKTHPADVGITIDSQKLELSPLHRLKGPTTKRLAPKFIHNSVISVRVWSSAERNFCRINIGRSVWDDTPLFAVSHTWQNAISSDGIPVQGYTDAIMKAVRMTATEHLMDSKEKDYYVWLDYFSTDQRSLFEVREATMKMAWVYSAAACTVVILDTTLSVSDKDFWSNRVWVMQEEALSPKLVFFNCNGQKCNIQKEQDGGQMLLKYDSLFGDNLENNSQKSPEAELAGLLVGSVIAKDGWGAKRDFSDFWPDML